MNNPELPLSFVMNLAQNEPARKRFHALSEAEKADVINKSYGVNSKEEMRSLVNSLTDDSFNM